jgi:hypothetical protein
MAEQAQLSQEALTQIPVAFLRRIKENARVLDELPIETLARLVPLAARAIRPATLTERISRGMSMENLAGADGGQLPGVVWAAGKSQEELEAWLTKTLAGEDEAPS